MTNYIQEPPYDERLYHYVVQEIHRECNVHALQEYSWNPKYDSVTIAAIHFGKLKIMWDRKDISQEIRDRYKVLWITRRLKQ